MGAPSDLLAQRSEYPVLWMPMSLPSKMFVLMSKWIDFVDCQYKGKILKYFQTRLLCDLVCIDCGHKGTILIACDISDLSCLNTTLCESEYKPHKIGWYCTWSLSLL